MIRRAILALSLLLGAGDLHAQLTRADSASLARAVAAQIDSALLSRTARDSLRILPSLSAFDSAVAREFGARRRFPGAARNPFFGTEIGSMGFVMVHDSVDRSPSMRAPGSVLRDTAGTGNTAAVVVEARGSSAVRRFPSAWGSREVLLFARDGSGWSFTRKQFLVEWDGCRDTDNSGSGMKVHKDC